MKRLVAATARVALMSFSWASAATPQTMNPYSAIRSDGHALSGRGASAAPPTPTVNDASLKKAARAFPKIRQINLKVQEKLKAKPAAQERQHILSQAREQEMMIVRQEGIEPDRYNEIIRRVDGDPVTNAKFASYVKQAEDPSKSM
jgi:hypothetical protein